MQNVIWVYLIIFIIYLINKQHKIGIEKMKKDYVCEIIHGDWQIDHYHKNYNFSYFEMIQGQLKLADEYKFRKGDEKKVMKIFEDFKNNLSEEYFSNRIDLPKTKHVLKSDTFLMYSLYMFLDKRYFFNFLCEEPMHKETITRKNYNGDGYNATYTATEFAIVVFKLLYTSYIYCKNNKAINPKGEYFNNETYIEELINTQQISISCYSP